MRPFSILIALLVSGLLYLFIMERDWLYALFEAGADEETPSSASEEETPERVKVVAIASSVQEIDSAVQLRGETEAAREVDVKAETSGPIISTPLRKGAFVEAGDLLCEIDAGTREVSLLEAEARLAEARAQVPTAEARIPEAEARVEEASALLEEAEINANAANRLVTEGFASETRVAATKAAVRSAQATVTTAQSGLESARAGVESAKANIQGAQAAVAAAKKELDRLRITAPFRGLLESDTAELGALMQPGSLCATVIQLDPIKLVGFVPETEVNRIETGAKAGARLAGGRDLQGTVTFISRSADPATRTFRVEIAVPNEDLSVRDGQTAEILIAAEGASAHLLPQSSLTLNDAGTLGVRIVDADQAARFVPVEVQRDTAEGIWVTGLPDEANVIVLGQEYVIDGVAVAPTYRGAEG
ncbi:membrane fusion protein, multidrug efflux system [Poseidonocella pacifica]|uniref:Membrane fusion protein, multidrug efflux system n=1 Tax=Poseidonocella pacifica TaxID=871651 RepID=A0A1I0YR46_9RHOB|nr:efflux RND transporter periplasmic adaptor subunit [Poseidonocella pacifica]SFB15681.1 membrane fusion protein, multidrug efflux system [Poseidonocella pacifica]